MYRGVLYGPAQGRWAARHCAERTSFGKPEKAAIEIMNKVYNQPAPVREEVVKLIKTDEDILAIIGEQKLRTEEVAEKMGLTREHVSRRISTLTKSGLLTRLQEGKCVFYHIK